MVNFGVDEIKAQIDFHGFLDKVMAYRQTFVIFVSDLFVFGICVPLLTSKEHAYVKILRDVLVLFKYFVFLTN